MNGMSMVLVLDLVCRMTSHKSPCSRHRLIDIHDLRVIELPWTIWATTGILEALLADAYSDYVWLFVSAKSCGISNKAWDFYADQTSYFACWTGVFANDINDSESPWSRCQLLVDNHVNGHRQKQFFNINHKKFHVLSFPLCHITLTH